MGRARKDEMREANNSHVQHLMMGGRASSSSSEDSLSPRPRGRHTERVERTDFTLTSQERAARDFDRDRGAPRERPSSRERSRTRATAPVAAPPSALPRPGMAPPMASAASDPLSTDRVATRQSRFGAPTGGGASGAAVDTEPRAMAAPRAARSPSPDLREVATKKFMRKHIYNDLGREDRAARFGLPAPLTADAERTAATRFSATPHIPASTTIRMDRDAKKRFRDLVNDPTNQASLRDPGNRVRIGPVHSSATEVRQRSGRSPETIERPEKDRYITVGGKISGKRGKARADHFFGYESS